MTVESWLFGLGFQDFVNAFVEFGYDNLDFIVSTNGFKNVFDVQLAWRLFRFILSLISRYFSRKNDNISF